MKSVLLDHLEGAGNRFAFLESADFPERRRRADFVRAICGATGLDGVVFMSGASREFEWDFYNSDGSDADMCGNAARCVGEYVLRRNAGTTFPVRLKTNAGIVEIDRIDAEFVVTMPASSGEKELDLATPDGVFRGLFVRTGVPHLVVESDDFDKSKRVCPHLRAHPDLGADGANVTLVKPEGATIAAVTFERGVENFTAACGTGAVAAAIWNRRRAGALSTSIVMPGGLLRVDLRGPRPLLSGPSNFVKTIEWPKEHS